MVESAERRMPDITSQNQRDRHGETSGILTARKMLENPWFWVLVAGVVYVILFVVVYAQEKFSAYAIVVLVSALVLFLAAGITFFFKDQAKNLQKAADLQVEEAFSRLDTQRGMVEGAAKIASTQIRSTAKAFEKIPAAAERGGGGFSDTFYRNIRGNYDLKEKPK